MRRPSKPSLRAPASVLRAPEAQDIGGVWTRAPLKTFWFDAQRHGSGRSPAPSVGFLDARWWPSWPGMSVGPDKPKEASRSALGRCRGQGVLATVARHRRGRMSDLLACKRRPPRAARTTAFRLPDPSLAASDRVRGGLCHAASGGGQALPRFWIGRLPGENLKKLAAEGVSWAPARHGRLRQILARP